MTATVMEGLDAVLLNRIQDEFPMCRRPFESLAQDIGADEQTVIDRLQALRESGVLRQVSAIFDTAALGYSSSLVAMRLARGPATLRVAIA